MCWVWLCSINPGRRLKLRRVSIPEAVLAYPENLNRDAAKAWAAVAIGLTGRCAGWDLAVAARKFAREVAREGARLPDPLGVNARRPLARQRLRCAFRARRA